MSQEHEPDLVEGDEEIARIRETRHRISERVGHDPYRLVAYYIEKQEAHQDKLIPAPAPEELDRTGTD
jgi:hypothetical protein